MQARTKYSPFGRVLGDSHFTSDGLAASQRLGNLQAGSSASRPDGYDTEKLDAFGGIMGDAWHAVVVAD